MAASALTDLDPTGTLSAVGAGVSLVGAALRLGTAAKKFQDARHTSGGSGGVAAGSGGGGSGVAGDGGGADAGPSNLHRSQTSPNDIPAAPKDPERERRAYETVNFVLREFGSRICAAGMVDEHALTKALSAATQHIEVNLFSGETNRLFESLAPKLADPILVNSVFTSIYFIGALTAELSTSLPNYKDAYVPVGPRLVQQLFRAAIGEDAFRDNLSANLDAYKTLTMTAGLMRPTDIGYCTFPRFPSFAPSRYSSRSLADVHRNRSTYEKLVKHFDRVGFPQPIPARQAEVGLVRDWKFLSGESNSRAFDVDKADRNIGENFGRVLYWLICSAERLPPGQAVIAYYDQHIELLKWIQHRMGYAVLYPAFDLNLGGPHAQLDRRLRATIESWVILMPSEAAQAAKRSNAEHWMATHIRNAAHAPPFVPPATATNRPMSMAMPPVNHTPPPVSQSIPPAGHTSPPVSHANLPPGPSRAPVPVRQPSQASSHAPSVASVPLSTNRSSIVEPASPPLPMANSPSTSPGPVELPTLRDIQPVPKTLEQRVEEIHQHFRYALVPQFQRLWSQPSADPGIRDSQCNVLAHTIERETIDRLDRIHIPENHPVRMHRKSLIDQAQELLDFLPVYKDLGPTATHGRPLPGALQQYVQELAASTVGHRPPLQSPQSTGSSPPPYSPNSPSSVGSTAPIAASSFLEKPKPTAIRRKAPPPPKKFVPAKALYDFEPDPDNEEELGFKEDDEIEIIEKTAAMEAAGWCRARVKGSKRIGLVPLEYVEIVENRPAPATAPNKPPVQHSGPSTHMPPAHNAPPSHIPSPYHNEPPLQHTPPSHTTHATQNPPTSQTTLPLHPSSPPHSIPHPGVANLPESAHAGAHPRPSKPPTHQQPAGPTNPPSTYQQTIVNVSGPMQQNAQGPSSLPQSAPAKSHMNKLEAAGLATAAIGAATKIGTFVEDSHHPGSGSNDVQDADGRQQHTSNHAGDSQNDGGNQYIADGAGQTGTGDQLSNNEYCQNTAVDPAAASDGIDSNAATMEQDSPPMVDLSAFGEAPFDPQTSVASTALPTTFGSEQYYIPQETFGLQPTEADLVGPASTTTDDFQTTTAASSTTFIDGPATTTSPFASLATTTSKTDTTTYTDTTVANADGTTSTYDTFTENQTSFTADASGSMDQAQWSTGVVIDDDDTYDLDC